MIDDRNSNKIYIMYMVMAFFIVLTHSYSIERFTVYNDALLQKIDRVVKVLLAVPVPIFFFMSSYLFYRKSRTINEYFAIVHKKIKTILIPMLLWSALLSLYVLATSYIKGSINLGDFSVFALIKRIILLQDNPVLWFMKDIFIFFLFYPVIEWILRKKYVTIIAIILTFCFNIWRGPTIGYSTCLYWLPVYLTGGFIGRYYDECFLYDKLKINSDKQILLYSVAAVLFSILCAFNYIDNKGLGIYIFRNLIIFPVWILSDCFRVRGGGVPWFLKSSMYIYSSHLLLCGFTEKLYIKCMGDSVISAILGYIFVPLFIMVVLLLIGAVVRKYLNPVWGIFTGNRS